ncbi:MAG: hypothetical protein RBU25_01590 [Lentisphaeria bacterium]|jgi:hypothetical protein|nr:hypothetical protein [Lentisphaeria bacterium]
MGRKEAGKIRMVVPSRRYSVPAKILLILFVGIGFVPLAFFLASLLEALFGV